MSEIRKDQSLMIIHALLEVINDSSNKDMFYISNAILNNIRELRKLSLQDSAILLNVSESSLNRFCKKIGFKNFSTFRDLINNDINLQDDTDYFQQEMADSDYIDQIKSEFDDIEKIDTKEIEKVCKWIYESKHCYLLTSQMYQNLASDFQESMFMHGKLLQIVTNKLNNTEIPKTSSNDSLIVLSMEMAFANSISSSLKNEKGRKILITQSDDIDIQYDTVLKMPACEIKSIQRYGIKRILEKIVVAYHCLSVNL